MQNGELTQDAITEFTAMKIMASGKIVLGLMYMVTAKTLAWIGSTISSELTMAAGFLLSVVGIVHLTLQIIQILRGWKKEKAEKHTEV